MTRLAGCDDHDIHAVVLIGFVKPKSHEIGVGEGATVQNHIPAGISASWA